MTPGAGEATRAGRAARAFEAVATWCSRAALWVAGAACLATLGVVCYAVAMRYFLNRPQSWTDELAGWLIVVTVMLAMPEAQRRGEHIGVDVLTGKLRGGMRRALAALSIGSVLAVAWLIVDEGLEMVSFTRMVGILSIALPEVDLWLIQALVPLGGALLLLIALAQLACVAAGIEPAGPESDRVDSHE